MEFGLNPVIRIAYNIRISADLGIMRNMDQQTFRKAAFRRNVYNGCIRNEYSGYSDEIELLFPKLLQDDFYQKKELPFTNGMYLTYTDNEALYFVDVTGTVRILYSLMSPWTESDNKAKTRHWIRSVSPSSYSKVGVKKKSSLFSLIPVIGSFIPDHYLIPYSYSVIRTVNSEYVLCIPSYELDNLPKL